MKRRDSHEKKVLQKHSPGAVILRGVFFLGLAGAYELHMAGEMTEAPPRWGLRLFVWLMAVIHVSELVCYFKWRRRL